MSASRPTPWLCLLVALIGTGCNALPKPTTTWRGEAEGRIKATVLLTSPGLPAKAWLVESGPEGAAGLLIFTKWDTLGSRYHHRLYVALEESWRPGADYVGLIKGGEFCTINPEHGGFVEGNTFISTYTYDYCARLARR